MSSNRETGRRRAPLRAALAVAVVLSLPATALAVGSVSTVSPRPLAMGGAFMAVEDELAAIAWNPGALAPPQCHRRGDFRFHINALGAPAIARETGLLTGVETAEFASLPAAERMSIAVGGVLKSLTFRRGGLACGALMLEEHLDPRGLAESKGLADAGDLLDGYYSSFCIAFRLAPRVSIGIAETVYAGYEGSERRFGIGRSYGALLKPNDKITVGLTYFDMPRGFAGYRRGVEAIAPRTMNAGLAYRPLEGLTICLDLRDLAEKHADTAFEPRAGLEWNLWGRAALRLGAYREEGGDVDVLTAGLGAIPMPGCRRGDGARSNDAFVLSYAVLLSAREGPRHLLSVVLHL